MQIGVWEPSQHKDGGKPKKKGWSQTLPYSGRLQFRKPTVFWEYVT